jgi:hypothetical protein
MNDVLKSKMLLVVVVLAGITLFFGVTNKYFINKIADRVIEKLQKDYSPSPYGSGIDPDKIDVSSLISKKLYDPKALIINVDKWNNED